MHVLADLSAYLDEELAPADRARVSTHLQDCGRCSAGLAELRATATLISALPSPQPSRSLVPAIAPRWNWLRPVRSLSAVTSGAFLMVFLVAAVAQSGSDLGGGPLTPFSRAQPAAAPGAPGDSAFATTATAAPSLASQPPTAAGAPAAAPQSTSGAESEEKAADAQRSARGAGGAAESTSQAEDLRMNSGLRHSEPPSPLIWLGIALLLAAIAGVAHVRLRAS